MFFNYLSIALFICIIFYDPGQKKKCKIMRGHFLHVWHYLQRQSGFMSMLVK